MLENLIAVMMEKPEMFRGARLWNECKTFVKTEMAARSGSRGT